MHLEMEKIPGRTIDDRELVAVFTRQSTKKPSQEKSIPRQRIGLQAWAKTIGWAYPEDPECFYEKKISGTRLNPELERLMRDLESGRRRGVLLDDLSRASRLALKTFQLWDVIKRTGALLAIRSRYLVINPQLDQQDILIFFEGMLNEAYWETLGRMSADGSRFRASKGLWCGGPVPSGFIRAGKGVLAPDLEHSREIELQLAAAESLSLRQASRFLRERVGLEISPSTLHHRAHNRIYESVLVYGKTRRGFYRNPTAMQGDPVLRKSQRGRPEETIVLPGAIKSPIPPMLAISPRSRLKGSRNNADGMGLRNAKAPPFALSGIAYCGFCDTRLVRRLGPVVRNGQDGARYGYLGCWTKDCVNHSRRQEAVEDGAITALSKLVENAAASRLMLRSAFEALRKDAAAKADRLREANRELEGACGRIERVMENMLAERAGAYAAKLSNLHQRLAAGRAELLQAEAAISFSLSPEIEDGFLVWCADIVNRWKGFSPIERLLMLRMGFRRATMGEGGIIELFPRMPLATKDSQNGKPPPRIELG